MAAANRVGKTIVNRTNSGRDIITSLDAHAEPVAAALDGQFGLKEPQWREFLRAGREQMEQINAELWDAESALAGERGDDALARAERDELIGTLAAETISTRMLLDSQGSGVAARYGLTGKTPRAPEELLSFAANAVDSLREADDIYERRGVVVSTAKLADSLEPHVTQLEDVLQKIAREERKAEGLLIKRDKVLERWERSYKSLATVLEGLYHLAGEPELAARIHPTAKRASGAEGPVETDPDDNADPDES